MRTLTDEELSAILREWRPEPAPQSLRARVFGRRRSRLWLWAAAAVVLIGIAMVWRSQNTRRPQPVPSAPRVDTKAAKSAPGSRGQQRLVLTPGGGNGLSGLPLPLLTVTATPIRRVDPVFPPGAKAAGVVRLNVRIGLDGRVIEPIVMSGDPVLAGAAVEAVKKWIYRPILLNGRPVEVVTQVDVEVKP